MNMLQQISNVAAASPEKIAYQSSGECITYGELWEQSNKIANSIKQLALPESSPITVFGHMSPSQITAFLGVVKAGHPYIPLDVSIPADRVKEIIEASKSSLVITTEPFETVVAPQIKSVNELMTINENSQETQNTWVTGDRAFYIIYTSGSTGKPKGVQISESNLNHFVHWVNAECSLSEGVYLNQAPYSFDLSVMDLYPALAYGRTLHAIPKATVENPAMLFEELQQSTIEVWTSTPSFAKICLMNPEWNASQMPHLKTFLFCGEVLPHQVAAELLKRFPGANVYNLYGPTETTVAVSAVLVTEELLQRYEELPIAKVDCGTLAVLDEQLQQATAEEKGELVISGPTVSSEGYLYAEEQSAKVFQQLGAQRVYRAGDLGYVKDDYIFYAGRSDFQIKLHGYRMEIEEIEKKIETLEEVISCAVLPIKKGEEVVSLTAVIALKEPLTEKPFKMTKHLKAQLALLLPNYMIPKKFNYVTTLPLNMNGKIDRKRLAVEVVL